MRILQISKYPPIEGGTSVACYWLAQSLAELGHEITVLTNADEVEDEYRINFAQDDIPLLRGYRKRNCLNLISTQRDASHNFIPQTNPYLSKLLGLGLNFIKNNKVDLIWAHYVEPYGIAALALSQLTGIPYIIQHAGSDLGRLGLTSSLSGLYAEVYRHAMKIITSRQHNHYFTSLGVKTAALFNDGLFFLPGDVFFPTPPTRSNTLRLLNYGKAASTKGSTDLVHALSSLEREGIDVKLTAYWGGSNLREIRRLICDSAIADNTLVINGFVPHWRIAEAIRESDAVAYLERNFSITAHRPIIPIETLGCGRILITTSEIASKPNVAPLITSDNTIIADDTVGLADALKRLAHLKKYPDLTQFPDISLLNAYGINNLEALLADIATIHERAAVR